ncbi:erythromycin esterase family protein [Amycolatopsis sp. cg5]|uniref:erythromycin esterase family protein n=1 Tax=Amycolatopsis sp. cg5 TaxID=3238802 RepID=UPI00352337B5
MSQDIRDFVTPSCELLAFGEPTHQGPAFRRLRNELFPQLAGHGFRSIALETDRVAAYIVDDYVREGVGTLEKVMSEGFSHNFGEPEDNRLLVAWLREYNDGRPAEERLAFHGFDAATENFSAPSPLGYLEYARDYLGLDTDFASLAGEDEQWSRTEAIMDPAMSIGDTVPARELRVLADDMLTTLYWRGPELIETTSRAEWFRAEANLTTGLDLLRYHKQASAKLEVNARVSRLMATRDAFMSQNLFAIRRAEADRGPTFVFANNAHLQRNLGRWALGGRDFTWAPAGSIVSSLVGERYVVVLGSLGRNADIGLGEPDADTFEGALQRDIGTWGLTRARVSGRKRTDIEARQGYFPLEQATVDGADALLHINNGAA